MVPPYLKLVSMDNPKHVVHCSHDVLWYFTLISACLKDHFISVYVPTSLSLSRWLAFKEREQLSIQFNFSMTVTRRRPRDGRRRFLFLPSLPSVLFLFLPSSGICFQSCDRADAAPSFVFRDMSAVMCLSLSCYTLLSRRHG